MDFDVPRDVAQRRMEFRELLEADIRAAGEARDAGGPLQLDELQRLFGRLQRSDIVRASLPEEVGGTNRTYLERTLLAEEFARVWPSLAVTVDSHNIVVEMIARQGKPWMQQRYVADGIAGRSIMGDMMSEPEAGSDTRNLQTVARLDGDHYVVNGVKMWTTNGVWANVALLTAVADREAYRSRASNGVIHLLVDRSVCEWSVRDLPLVGLKAGTTSESVFRDCNVPAKYLFHDAGQGYRQNLIVRGWARVLLGAWSVGIMQAALEEAVRFARSRRTFGKPIASHQLVQDRISSMVVDLETSRLLTYRAATLMDKGVRCDVEQATAKLHACESVQRVTANAIQILGARGLTTREGHLTERHFRDARFLTIAEGTSEIMKLIIGRKVLGIAAID
jgi:alkylation response protein AidB-like acyl-CoA dehydrogenase